MSFKEDAAVLLLAEHIARGKEFHEGMSLPFAGTSGISVTVTSPVIEKAAKIAFDRKNFGYAGGSEDAAKAEAGRAKNAAEVKAAAPSKVVEKKGKKKV